MCVVKKNTLPLPLDSRMHAGCDAMSPRGCVTGMKMHTERGGILAGTRDVSRSVDVVNNTDGLGINVWRFI